MTLLIIAADKGGHFAPFVEEQIAALQDLKHEVVRYAVHGKGIQGYLHEIPRLRQTICTLRPDIIHAHYGLCGLLANITTRTTPSLRGQGGSLTLQRGRGGSSIPVITTYHGSDINTPRVLRLSRIAMHLSAWNIFVSRANIRTARAEDKSFAPWAYRGDNYSLLPCGVTLSDDQLLSRTEARKCLAEANVQCTISDGKTRKSVLFSEIQHHRLILFAGAFSNPVKDIRLAEEVIDQYTTLNSDLPNPSKGGAIRVSEYPLSEGVRGSRCQSILLSLQHYTRTEVNWLMCAADCLLLTSRSEGSPQVVKEAMACGCPIVSVDVGDVRERVEGIEGCYVAKSRTPQELADLLRTALQITPPPLFAENNHSKSYTDAAPQDCTLHAPTDTLPFRTDARRHLLSQGLTNPQVARTLSALYAALLQR